MAYGVRVLSGTQLGGESTAGTAVAATMRWRGPVVFPEDDSEIVYNEEDVAIGGGVDRTHMPAKMAAIEFPETEITYQHAGLLFNMGVKSLMSGVQDGSGSDYIYAFPMFTTAAPTIKTFTVEGFDNNQEYEAEYCMLTEITLKGEAKKAWTISGKGFGRQVSQSTKTGSLNLAAVEDLLFQKSKLYIDAIGGTIGTTQKSGTLLEAEIKIKTGIQPIFTASGNLYYDAHKVDKWEVSGKVVLEHDAIAAAQWAIEQAQTAQLMRIKTEGSAVQTPGTTYSVLTALFDMPFKFSGAPKIGERNGNNTMEFPFVSRYNLTSASGPQFTFVNELSALP